MLTRAPGSGCVPKAVFAMAIQTLLNAFGQQIGQMLVTRHAVSLMGTIQINKPVQIGVKKRCRTLLTNLYVK